MDPATILKLITNSTWIVTQLLGDEIVKFEKDKYELEVEENCPLGPILQLRARVILEDEQLEFYIKNSKSSRKTFELNPATGELFLVRNLDYEEEKTHSLTVGARVGTAKEAETSVSITVLDQNEFPPVFSRRTYETQITEEDDRHLPKPILKVSASDQDGGRWGVLRYVLSGEGAATDAFPPSPPSARGGTKTKPPKEQEDKSLNYEESFADTQDSSVLSLKQSVATAGGVLKQEGQPTDEGGERRRGVDEAEGTRDDKEGQNRRSGDSKSHSSSSNQKGYFWVDKVKGDVLLLRPLDRDPPSGRSQWRLKMTATDGEWETTSDVIINVKDVNDNAPFFPEETLLTSVPENAPKGTLVTRVTATDNDDPSEARNAKVFYSLDKNVVDESTGLPIFEVDNSTGVITTHLCCLDREKTPSYSLQIVATDGGGLKGTGTVSIEVADENDVGPRFSRDNWVLKVTEDEDLNSPIGSISVTDPDVTNKFIYRITSGDEGRQFDIKGKADGSGAKIYSKIKLDYENPKHREGFRFKVEVTDLGKNGWSNKSHTASSWVSLILLNKNDNAPKFELPINKISLSEETLPGSIIASFRATDVDFGEESKITYSISTSSNKDRLFSIDKDGVVILSKPLDRETMAHHKLEILAADRGEPPQTATSTFEVTVTDVNDSPPKLSSSHHFQVLENSAPQVIGKVHLDDPDDWTLGHGPPFTMVLDPKGSRSLSNKISVSFDPGAKEGHGVGVLRTLVSLDREERKTLLVPLVVTDSGFPKMSATITITVTVADVNDNPMSSASKQVIVHALQPIRSNVPLGRVYVRDPDDWDSQQKKYSWSRPHPLFILNTTSGDLFMKPDARPGRYELGFHVSDQKHGQNKVEANVSVLVRALANVDVKTTNPLVIHMDPFQLVHRSEGNPSYLDLILETIQRWLSEAVSSDSSEFRDNQTSKVEVIAIQRIRENSRVKSSLWIHTPHYSALQNFLLIQKAEQLEKIIGTSIVEIGTTGCLEELQCDGRGCWSKIEIQNQFSLVDANETSIVGPELQLMSGCGCQPPDSKADVNGTVFGVKDEDRPSGDMITNKEKESNNAFGGSAGAVIPKTDTLINSGQRELSSVGEGKQQECVYNPCLNGGKCLPTSTGYRCICPFGSFGKICKILSRKFEGSPKMYENVGKFAFPYSDDSIYGSDTLSGGSESVNHGSWSWLEPMPTCSNIHISLEVMTSQENALLLYTGLQIPRKLVPSAEKFYRPKFRNNLPMLSSNLVLNRLQKNRSDSISEGISILSGDNVKHRSKAGGQGTLLSNERIAVKLNNNVRTKRSSRTGIKYFSRKNAITKFLVSRKFLVKSKKVLVRSRNSLLRANKLDRNQVPSPKKFNSNKNPLRPAVYSISNRSLTPMNPETDKQKKKDGVGGSRKHRNAPPDVESADMLMLEIQNGHPGVYLNLGNGLVHLYLNESYPVNDQKWHRIDIIWNKEHLRMFVDLCSHKDVSEVLRTLHPDGTVPSTNETKNKDTPDGLDENLRPSLIASSETFSPFRSVSSPSRYISDVSSIKDRSCRGAIRLPGKARQLNIRGSPLQLGGVSRSLEKSLAYPGFLKQSLKGCIRNLRINKQLKDLGHSLLSHRSYPGCKDHLCEDSGRMCGIHGQKCSEEEDCACHLGWTGPFCDQPTVPSTFLSQSFATLALSFTPSSFITKIQLRIRSYGNEGEIVMLSSSHKQDSMSLQLIGGYLCVTLQKSSRPNATQLCLLEAVTNDGNWHDVTAEKSGSSLVLQIDDGDGSNYNSSVLLDDESPFNISRHDGCHVGGTPEYVDGKVNSVNHDFSEGCIDDLRLNGYLLPLPPHTNATHWAQVTMMQNVQPSCVGTPQCKRFTCRPPFTCFDSWNSYYCGCGEGKKLSHDRSICEDINECQWGPCLNGGTCFNTVPGYLCQCQDNYEGNECQMLVGKRVNFPASLGVMVCLTSFCVLLLLLIGIILLIRRHQSSYGKKKLNSRCSKEESGETNSEGGTSPPIIEPIQLMDRGPPQVTKTHSWGPQNVKGFQSDDRTFSELEARIECGDSSRFTSSVRSRKSGKSVNFLPSAEEAISLETLNDLPCFHDSPVMYHEPPHPHCSSEDLGHEKRVIYIARSNRKCSFPILKKLDSDDLYLNE